MNQGNLVVIRHGQALSVKPNQIILLFITAKLTFGNQIFLIGQYFHDQDLNILQIVHPVKTTKSNNGRTNKTRVS